MAEISYILHNRRHMHSSQLHGDFECLGPLRFDGATIKVSPLGGQVKRRNFTCLSTFKPYMEAEDLGASI